MTDKNRRFSQIVAQMRDLLTEISIEQSAKNETLSQAADKLSVADISELFIGAREYRNRKLGVRFFGEPAWDILLQLHLAHYRQQAISVSAAVTFGDTPPTTGLRWLKLLEAERLIERRADPDDDRRSFVALTSTAVAMIDDYLSDFQAWVVNQAQLRKL